MALSAGTRLGPYEIVAAIGAGGMGEVYRARDTRLARAVAIKVLTARLSDDPALRERFEREARAVSSLSHPHICALFDIGHQDGLDFLVLEYLDGETLAARLQKGPLAPGEVLQFAVEIADALDKAHRTGIVHRDLKPANVIVTKSGTKLLDFGLAKAAGLAPVAGAPTELATAPGPLTAHGTILGTFQYMAPEQLEGKDADARTDIFAFGALVFEMATGRKAFEGKSQASLIGAIMTTDPPPIATLQPLAPPALDHVVRTCLAKDPDERWQNAGDIVRELKWIAQSGSQAGVPAAVVRRRVNRERLAWVVAGLFVIVALVAVWRSSAGATRSSDEVRRFAVNLSAGAFGGAAAAGSGATVPRISPDGRFLVFSNSSGEAIRRQLWLRPLDSLDARPLAGTAGAGNPFWSPDSRSVGFFAGGKLKRIDVINGSVTELADVRDQRGGTWGTSGTIVFSPASNGPLFAVSARGGPVRPATTLERSRAEYGHRWPHFLPDGRHVVYLVRAGEFTNNNVYVAAIESAEPPRLVLSVQSETRVAPSGLVFVRDGTLTAHPFDFTQLVVTGDPVALADHAAFNGGNGAAGFSVSNEGTITYLPGGDATIWQFRAFDRSGNALGPVSDPETILDIELSPDETKIAVDRTNLQGGRNVWTIDLARKTPNRVTSSPWSEMNPVWSPDGSRIAFASNQGGNIMNLRARSLASGEEEKLLTSDVDKVPYSWSVDGKYLIYGVVTTNEDLWVLPLTGDRKPFPYLQTPFNETQPEISPDGQWVAYASDETGRPAVYVDSFPKGRHKTQVSAGGSQPRWSRNGRELLYLQGGDIYALSVSAGTSLRFGDPTPILAGKNVMGVAVGLSLAWPEASTIMW